MLAPIVKVIEVPCSQKMAFRIFLSEMNTWWPLGKFTVSAMGGKPAKELRVEARQGGTIVEVTHDDKECLWGTILSYEPDDFLRMSFHIPLPTEVVEDRSLVEVRFTALGDDRTRVQLTQSNWEAFGKRAEMLQGGYGGGWVIIFEQAFRNACNIVK
jgi:uncharacterized protein YndB with AHSA1/START domain